MAVTARLASYVRFSESRGNCVHKLGSKRRTTLHLSLGQVLIQCRTGRIIASLELQQAVHSARLRIRGEPVLRSYCGRSPSARYRSCARKIDL